MTRALIRRNNRAPKITEKGLAPLIFKIPSKNSNKACVEALKSSWEKLDNYAQTFNKRCFENLNLNRGKFDLISKVAREENCSRLTLIEAIENASEAFKEKELANNISFADLNVSHETWNAIPSGKANLVQRDISFRAKKHLNKYFILNRF